MRWRGRVRRIGEGWRALTDAVGVARTYEYVPFVEIQRELVDQHEPSLDSPALAAPSLFV